ncbi:phage/plasmid primase, P4 family, partial [Oceanispirochaeta sp.]|uniref:DNA primase family protein n=1 Tax=Oceanispirochaeta sp. TaxID=2035350 RepID=UPI002601C0B6
MAEKRLLNRMSERLRRFEVDETLAIRKALASEEEYSQDLQVLMKSWLGGDLARRPGLLALCYNCCSALVKEIPPEEQTGERFFRLRWSAYLNAQKERENEPPSLEEAKYLDREALFVLSTNKSERGETFSDFFNARMMIEDWGEDIRYCAPWKKWLIWDSQRWLCDELGAIYELGEKSINSLFEKAPQRATLEEALAMMAHARRSSSAHKVETMLFSTRWNLKIRVSPDELDRNLFLFNCANGMIDLRCGRLLTHDRNALITKVSPVTYLPDSSCTVWKRFLKDIFKGNLELIRFVQKFLGCSLTGDMSCQSMFILYGNGANGKSTFINVVNHVMGDYATTTPTETFMQKKGEQATNDIARLKGARFVTAMESDDNGRLAESVIKRLTGNDMISARFLYGEYFQFLPTFKIVMATNHKPRVSGMDLAIWRRIKLIPFEATFPEEKQDKKLTEKLNKESS